MPTRMILLLRQQQQQQSEDAITTAHQNVSSSPKSDKINKQMDEFSSFLIQYGRRS